MRAACRKNQSDKRDGQSKKRKQRKTEVENQMTILVTAKKAELETAGHLGLFL